MEWSFLSVWRVVQCQPSLSCSLGSSLPATHHFHSSPTSHRSSLPGSSPHLPCLLPALFISVFDCHYHGSVLILSFLCASVPFSRQASLVPTSHGLHQQPLSVPDPCAHIQQLMYTARNTAGKCALPRRVSGPLTGIGHAKCADWVSVRVYPQHFQQEGWAKLLNDKCNA